MVIRSIRRLLRSLVGLRSWLERNKIFFETVVAVALGLMAFFVARAAKDVSASQLELARAQVLPIFRLDDRVDTITLVNHGGHAIGAELTVLAFLRIRAYGARDGADSAFAPWGPLLARADVPVYCEVLPTWGDRGATQGQMFELSRLAPSEDPGFRDRLERELTKAVPGMKRVHIQAIYFLDLSYEDVSGKGHRDLLEFDTLKGDPRVREGESERIRRDHRAGPLLAGLHVDEIPRIMSDLRITDPAPPPDK